MPRARDLEEDSVLAFELDLPVVQAAGEQHEPVHVEEVRLSERLGGFGLRSGAGGHIHTKDSLLRAGQKLAETGEVTRGGSNIGIVSHENLRTAIGRPAHVGHAHCE